MNRIRTLLNRLDGFMNCIQTGMYETIDGLPQRIGCVFQEALNIQAARSNQGLTRLLIECVDTGITVVPFAKTGVKDDTYTFRFYYPKERMVYAFRWRLDGPRNIVASASLGCHYLGSDRFAISGRFNLESGECVVFRMRTVNDVCNHHDHCGFFKQQKVSER